MASARTMKFAFVGGSVWVGVHGVEAPTSEEWRLHCLEIERVRNETRGVLVFTLGGGPDSHHRKAMRDSFHGLTAPPTAVLTGSALVRGIVTALNWYYGDDLVAAFAPSELERALVYLEQRGVPLSRREIASTLRALASELSIELPEKLRASL
jgi:hypothetical protein